VENGARFTEGKWPKIQFGLEKGGVTKKRDEEGGMGQGGSGGIADGQKLSRSRSTNSVGGGKNSSSRRGSKGDIRHRG